MAYNEIAMQWSWGRQVVNLMMGGKKRLTCEPKMFHGNNNGLEKNSNDHLRKIKVKKIIHQFRRFFFLYARNLQTNDIDEQTSVCIKVNINFIEVHFLQGTRVSNRLCENGKHILTEVTNALSKKLYKSPKKTHKNNCKQFDRWPARATFRTMEIWKNMRH